MDCRQTAHALTVDHAQIPGEDLDLLEGSSFFHHAAFRTRGSVAGNPSGGDSVLASLSHVGVVSLAPDE